MHANTLQPSRTPVLAIAWRIALNIECRRRGIDARIRRTATDIGRLAILEGASTAAALAAAHRYLDRMAPHIRRCAPPPALA